MVSSAFFIWHPVFRHEAHDCSIAGKTTRRGEGKFGKVVMAETAPFEMALVGGVGVKRVIEYDGAIEVLKSRRWWWLG
jgi:hypothetical protein